MKYANGILRIKHKHFDAFICAKTYKRMIEMSEGLLTMNYFNVYWSKIGNDEMKKIAKDKEGIWISKGVGTGYKNLTFKN